MRSKRTSGFGVTVLYALIGAIVGSLIGHFLERIWAPLGYTYVNVGFPNPWVLNLNVVGGSLGVWLKLNLLGIVGLLAGVLEAQRRR